MSRSDRLRSFFLQLSLVGLVSLSYAGQSWACASCGSGGDESMVLFPAETTKAQTGLVFTPTLQSTGPDGSVLTSSGPDQRATFSAAVGQSLGRRAFVVLAASVLTNFRTDHSGSCSHSCSETGLGDPVISGRWTAVMPSLAEPWIPQVQILAGYRPALARSIHTSADPNQLDAFGSGFSEVRSGLDIWFGMFPVKPGLAIAVTESLPARYEGILLQPGRLVRGTSSLTVLAPVAGQALKFAAGVTMDRRSDSRLDGERVEDSRQTTNGWFASADLNVSDPDTVKLSVSQQGGWGKRMNSVLATSLSVSWSRVVR